MSGWLIDTNVLSELRRPRPSQRVRAFVAAQSADGLFSSDAIFAEVRFGVELKASPVQRADLVRWLDHVLRPQFAGRVLPVTEDVILRWHLILESGRKRGHTFSEPDLIIAAVAAQAGLIVVSRDTTHFVAADVPAFDPWSWNLYVAGRTLPIADADSPDTLSRAAAMMPR